MPKQLDDMTFTNRIVLLIGCALMLLVILGGVLVASRSVERASSDSTLAGNGFCLIHSPFTGNGATGPACLRR